ncbi:hypothetical protein PoB_001385100 [Plakobranchus ocellatus]|uniref:Uncharacterized protein n=1 Tax=Plakobranchus ocellatus TaxID=259542 RepID=A0AAV3YV82_9GAST|nr:hypothetical protein PoB_001385100 [Plakobranchus ocellatus]
MSVTAQDGQESGPIATAGANPSRESGGSPGRAVGNHPRGPGFDSQSGPNQISLLLCVQPALNGFQKMEKENLDKLRKPTKFGKVIKGYRGSSGSSGRAVRHHPRGQGFDSQSGPSQIFIAPLCLSNT